MYAVKPPTGTILTYTAQETREASIKRFLADRAQGFNWDDYRAYGWRCIPVTVRQAQGARGWSFPVCDPINKQDSEVNQ